MENIKKSKIISKQIDLGNIKGPEFLLNMNYDELKALSSQINAYILELVAKKGGHLSSNLGAIDATISICRNFNLYKDKIIFDVGHQTYTYKILTGRDISTIRDRDGISGFQKMNESIFDHYEAGHSSTSISSAYGMAVARDLSNQNHHVVAFIGDAALANGLALEGLHLIGKGKTKVIIIYNDNDKLNQTNIDPIVFNGLGFDVIGPVDGHNIKAMDEAFALAKSNTKPVLVHLKTLKGKGYEIAEKDVRGIWHGVSPFNIETTEKLSKGKESWSNIYASILDNEMKNNEKVVTIIPATSVGSSLEELFDKYPNRVFDVGIAEEHAVTFASGLAVNKFRPVISIYSTFLQRSYDEVHHDLARMNLGVTFLVDRCGFVGNDGETHQGIYDEAFLSTIPNVVIAMAKSKEQALNLFNESFKHNCPFFIRYPRETVISSDNSETKFGKWNLEHLGQTKKTAIISVGPITEELKNIIIKDNIDVTLYNAIYLNPIDTDVINELLDYEHLIIYNAYATEGGLVNKVSKQLALSNYKGKLTIKCIPDEFIKQATIEEQRASYALRAEDIIKLI